MMTSLGTSIGKIVGSISTMSVTTYCSRCNVVVPLVVVSKDVAGTLVCTTSSSRLITNAVPVVQLKLNRCNNNENDVNVINNTQRSLTTINPSSAGKRMPYFSIVTTDCSLRKATTTMTTTMNSSLRLFSTSTASSNDNESQSRNDNNDDNDSDDEPDVIKVNIKSKCSYGVFNLPKNTSKDVVKRIFYQVASIYHPDRPETGDAETFRAVRKAYEKICLSDNGDNNNDGMEEMSLNDIIMQSMSATQKNAQTFTKFDDDETDTRSEVERIESEFQISIDEQTRQEIIRDYNAMLEDGAKAIRGGGWEMARYIVESDLRDQERRKRYQKKYGIATFLEPGRMLSDDDIDINIEKEGVSLPHRRRRRK